MREAKRRLLRARVAAQREDRKGHRPDRYRSEVFHASRRTLAQVSKEARRHD